MGTSSKPAPAPEPLPLSADDHDVLQQLRQGLHAEIIGQYEAHVSRGMRTVDPARWKHVRSENELHAYRERETAEPEDRDSQPIQPQAWMAARSQFPRVLVVGTVPGSLDDVMYAHTFHDTESLRTNALYERDGSLECAVLNTLEGATDEDPYRVASVAWLLRSYPIVRDRGVLTYMDLRLAKLRNGEHIGVRVTHSIRHEAFKQPKHSSRVVRVELSMATIFRQFDAGRVEVYTIHFIDPKGSAQDSLVLSDISNSFVVQELTKALFSMTTLADTALNKKLCHRVKQRLRERLQRGLSGSLAIDAAGETPQQCEHCDKKLGGLFKSSGRACQLCDKLVCSRCITKRELVIDATAVERPFEFCEVCIKQTGVAPAENFARQELRERREAQLRDRKSKLSASSGLSPTAANERVRATPV